MHGPFLHSTLSLDDSTFDAFTMEDAGYSGRRTEALECENYECLAFLIFKTHSSSRVLSFLRYRCSYYVVL